MVASNRHHQVGCPSPTSVATTLATTGTTSGVSSSPSSIMIMEGSSSTTSSSTTTRRQRELSIYWDYENVPLPSKWSKKPSDASKASKAIVRAVSKYGRIVDRRLYFDIASEGKGGGGLVVEDRWSALDSSGFDLVNTPRRSGKKESLDKKLIADVLTFAWDSCYRNDCKPCVVLITGDGDYAYVLQKLRDRGCMSIVIYGRDEQVASVLRDAADVALSFENDVLMCCAGDTGGTTTTTTASISLVLPSPTSTKQIRQGNNNHKPVSPVNSSKTTTTATTMEDARTLCNAMLKSHGEGWVLGTRTSECFRSAFRKVSMKLNNKEAFKTKYQQARDLAVANGWLIKGRRCVRGSNSGNIVTVPNGRVNDPLLNMKEDYLRVTMQGKESVCLKKQENTTNTLTAISKKNSSSLEQLAVHGAETKLILKNVPADMKIKDLVEQLEQQYNVGVIRGTFTPESEYPSTSSLSANFKYAHLQVTSKGDADRLLGLSKSSALVIDDGTILNVEYDTQNTHTLFTRDPMQSYERPTIASSPTTDVDMLAVKLCEAVKRQGKDPDGWAEGGSVAVVFRSATEKIVPKSQDYKDRFRKTRADAIEKKYIQIGRRSKLANGMGQIEVVPNICCKSNYSMEIYLRLTETGKLVAHKYSQNLFLSSLPPKTDVRHLVKFLETVHYCKCQKALVKQYKVGSKAHVEFASSRDAETILNLGTLSYKGKVIKVAQDLMVPCFAGVEPSKFYNAASSENVPETVVALSPDAWSLLSESKSTLSSSSSFSSTTNGFLNNLPRATLIYDLVEYMETTFGVNIRRATIAEADPSADFTSAHIEFESAKDFEKVAKSEKGGGIVLGGRFLRLRSDRSVPEWEKCEAHLLYEKEVDGSGDTLVNPTDEEGSTDEAEPIPEVHLSVVSTVVSGRPEQDMEEEDGVHAKLSTTPKENAVDDTALNGTEEKINLTGEIESPSPTDDCRAAKMPFTKESVEVGNLLFGDHLEFFYSQTKPKGHDDNTKAAQDESDRSLQSLQITTGPHEIPDLLWS